MRSNDMTRNSSFNGRGKEQQFPHPLVSCMFPLLAIVVLTVLVVIAIWYWQRSFPATVTVPQVIGLDRAVAVQQLEKKGLQTFVIADKEPSEKYPENVVLTISPPPGRQIKSGRVVRILLSAGSSFTKVPDVRKVSKVTARSRLALSELQIADEEYKYDDEIVRDAVISITPLPGTKVAKQSSVKLVISQGPREDEYPVVSEDNYHLSTIKVTLPEDDGEAKEVQIDVTDSNGLQTVYRQNHDPGDEVTYTVEGVGPSVAEVYFGTRKIKTVRF